MDSDVPRQHRPRYRYLYLLYYLYRIFVSVSWHPVSFSVEFKCTVPYHSFLSQQDSKTPMAHAGQCFLQFTYRYSIKDLALRYVLRTVPYRTVPSRCWCWSWCIDAAAAATTTTTAENDDDNDVELY
jgi:hypothetical protein